MDALIFMSTFLRYNFPLCPQPPKTPIQKLKGHFSTGHAESPATIVVGKAHAKAVLPTGCAPKFVLNTALTKESMNMNEDLTGVWLSFGGGHLVLL